MVYGLILYELFLLNRLKTIFKEHTTIDACMSYKLQVATMNKLIKKNSYFSKYFYSKIRIRLLLDVKLFLLQISKFITNYTIMWNCRS